GLEFMPDIDLGKLGLEELIIYVPQFIDYESVFPKDWLKSFFPLSSPRGTLLMFYVPIDNEEFLINVILQENKIQYTSKVWLFRRSSRFQPRLTLSHVRDFSLFKRITFDVIEKHYKKERFSNELRKKLLGECFDGPCLEEKPRIDSIDLLLLASFELDAFQTLKSLSQRYDVKFRTLKKHVDRHINEASVVKGIFLKGGSVRKLFGQTTLVVLEFYDVDEALRIADLLVQLDIALGLKLGHELFSGKAALYAWLVNPLSGLDELFAFFVKKRREGVIADFSKLDTMAYSVRSFTIPVLNFNMDTRTWDVDTDRAGAIFKRRYKLVLTPQGLPYASPQTFWKSQENNA
ncbi:MAG: hypothetical protein ABWK00_04610, partial [Desulfurococcaceae archaeon]